MDGLLQPPAETSAPEVSNTVVDLRITAKPSSIKSPQTTTDESNEHSTIKLRKHWLRKGDHFTCCAGEESWVRKEGPIAIGNFEPEPDRSVIKGPKDREANSGS